MIVRYQVSHGEAEGDEIAIFGDLEEARAAFDAGRTSGAYANEGTFWSRGTAYELLRRTAEGYVGLEGEAAGPDGLVGPPTIRSGQLGSTWSLEASRRAGWP